MKNSDIIRLYEQFTTAGHADVAEWWRAGQDGASATAIACHLTGVDCPDRYSTALTPCDAGDFRRCQLLLEAAPSISGDFARMGDVSVLWGKLVEAWPRLLAILDEENPGWRGCDSVRTSRRFREALYAAECGGEG